MWREIPAFHTFTNGQNVYTAWRNINFWITLLSNSLKAKIPLQVLFDADYAASFGDKLLILFSGRSFYILAKLWNKTKVCFLLKDREYSLQAVRTQWGESVQAAATKGTLRLLLSFSRQSQPKEKRDAAPGKQRKGGASGASAEG